MIYILEILKDGNVDETKEFKSIKQIVEFTGCTASAVTKNFKCRDDPNEKPSKKISQKIFDSKYNVKSKEYKE